MMKKALTKLGSMAYNAMRKATRGAKAADRGAGRVVQGAARAVSNAARDVGEIASGDFRRLGQAGRNAVASGYKALRRSRDKVTNARIARAEKKIVRGNVSSSRPYMEEMVKAGRWTNEARNETMKKFHGIDLDHGYVHKPAYGTKALPPYLKFDMEAIARAHREGAVNMRRNLANQYSPKAQSWGAKMALGGAAAAGYYAQKRAATGSPAMKKRLYNR